VGEELNEFLWYIPNTVEAGHRGDDTTDGCRLGQAQRVDRHPAGVVPTAIAARSEVARIGDRLLCLLRTPQKV
jgi:hypothetical protein